MPGLVRKLLIFAAVDGLILQPLSPAQSRTNPGVKIAYKDNAISSTGKDGKDEEEREGKESAKGFEAWGVVGISFPSARITLELTGWKPC